jgi:N-carbamoylputrescine amidase
MTSIRVALLQMVGHGWDWRANLEHGEAFCRRAREEGADIALFPEMWNVGYTFFDRRSPSAGREWRAQALTLDSPFVRRFRDLARELEMAIAITYLERWTPLPRNVVSLIDRHGEVVLTYAKVHTCDFDEEAALTPGDGFVVDRLETAHGRVTVGAMICFDREFPESARVLMLQGAELILTPNACDLEENRLGQFRARAYENMVGVAMTNYAAPKANGHSVAYDGMAFGEDESSRDTCLVKAGEEEGVYVATFDMDALRAYRAREVWGNGYRKPNRYELLVSCEVSAPFLRVDSRRGEGQRGRH